MLGLDPASEPENQIIQKKVLVAYKDIGKKSHVGQWLTVFFAKTTAIIYRNEVQI